MRLLVDGCYLMAAGAVAPVLAYRAWTTGKYRADWDQRRGYLPNLPPSDRRVWVHAVSMGEVNAVRGLVDTWRQKSPATEFIISTTTDTGQARAKQVFPDLPVVRYPLDFSWFVTRALDRIKPTMIVLVELEVWYQFVTLAVRRGIPVAVVNGRLSERSVRRFGWVRPVVRRMFEKLAWVGAQDEVYAERFRRIGVPPDRVGVTGSVKWDGAEVTDRIAGADAAAGAMGLRADRPLWVAGSTGPGEEQVILEAYELLRKTHQDPQLMIVPRKPERFDEVADLITQAGYTCSRRSQHPDASRGEMAESGTGFQPVQVGTDRQDAGPTQKQTGRMPVPQQKQAGKMPVPQVFLGDTMGELRKFYSLASVVFVGRSLAEMGGSDTMEVAALAKPIVVGPHNENFTDTVAQLQRGEAVRILSVDLGDPGVVDQLAQVVGTLLHDHLGAEVMGRRAREVVLENRGATQRTLAVLSEMLDRAQHRPA
ncbi:MAG: 3-deoxy-D-manno-octulosonic acid transferase [Planctomycetes bacterium]|nr:3-deoxy-D-manno-octulosonic acid transferase [Planctomycetota bacterium]